MVLLVVGGSRGSLRMVHTAMQPENERPVVVIPYPSHNHDYPTHIMNISNTSGLPPPHTASILTLSSQVLPESGGAAKAIYLVRSLHAPHAPYTRLLPAHSLHTLYALPRHSLDPSTPQLMRAPVV